MTMSFKSKNHVYKTKPRLDIFNQSPTLPPKQSHETFWDEDDVYPFQLSVSNHFQKKSTQKWQNDYRGQSTSTNRDYRPANRQYQRQQQSRPQFKTRRDDSYMYDRPYSTLLGYFAQKIYTNWIEKELNFSMSKLSFLVLIIGLFFLSSLLFITGFLMAVNVYDIKPPQVVATGTLNSQNIAPPLPNASMPNAIPNISMPPVSLQIQPSVTSQSINTQQANSASFNTMPGTQAIDPTTVRMPTVYAQLPTQALPPAPIPSMPANGTPYIQQQAIMPQQQIQQPQAQPVQQFVAQPTIAQTTAQQTYQTPQTYSAPQQIQSPPLPAQNYPQQSYQPPAPPQQYYPGQATAYPTYVQPNYQANR